MPLKNIIVFCICLLISINCLFSQKHLTFGEPPKNFQKLYLDEYGLKKSELHLRIITIGPWFPFTLLELTSAPESNEYFLSYRTFSMGSNDLRESVLESIKKPIDFNDSKMLKGLLYNAVMSTKYYDFKEERFILDGVTYIFSIYSDSGVIRKSGIITVWDQDSEMNELERIIQMIIKSIKSDEQVIKFDTELQKRIETLTKKQKPA